MAKLEIHGTFTKTGEKAIPDSQIRALKQEISRKASMANKRLKRLEKNNLTDVPAYRQYVEHGGVKFSVKGKSYNELQKELSRVNHFINSETSTVRGTTKVLKEMANNTGLSYSSSKELLSLTSQFFELASKVQQYLDNTQKVGQAIGYQKIWQAINEYVDDNQIELNGSIDDINSIIDEVAQLAASNFANETIDDMLNSFMDDFNF